MSDIESDSEYESDCEYYGCSFYIGIDDIKDLPYKTRLLRWEKWKNLRNTCLDYEPIQANLNENVSNILKSTYPLNEYTENSMLDAWGCQEDIEACDFDIIFHGNSIYSLIEINFYSENNPPFKWCEYMKDHGFKIKFYYVDLDRTTVEKMCGEYLYENNSIVSNKYIIPYEKIDKNILEDLYDENITFKSYKLNLDRMKDYSNKIFLEQGFCFELCELLNLYGIGPDKIAMCIFTKKNINRRLELLEEQLENKMINEGEYLDKCNGLKELYKDIRDY